MKSFRGIDMTRDRTRMALKCHIIRRWKKGIIKEFEEEPTQKMFYSFIAGFNMGYDAHKTKRLK